MKAFFSIALFVFLLFPAKHAHAWEMPEASLLLPFPSAAEQNELLSVSSQGEAGLLLPPFVIERLPILVASLNKTKTYNELLKVVALRIDPCFKEGDGWFTSCRRQIRLVWQPLVEREGKLLARDAAVHSFYDLSATHWNAFLADYQRLRGAFPQVAGAPLGVHPTMAAQGLGGEFWRQLKEILLKYCGERSLTRATAMTLDFNENQWVFIGVDVKAGETTPIKVPRTPNLGQSISMTIGDGSEFRATVFPFAMSRPALWLLDNSEVAKKKLSTAELAEASREFFRLENPKLHDTGNTDCASCHLASPALVWGERNLEGWADLWRESAFKSQENLENPTKGTIRTNHLRAFGYFNRSPILSQRVINETAVAVERLKETSSPAAGRSSSR